MDGTEIQRRRLAFDDCAQTDENGVEFWYARDIMEPLGYVRWENFHEAIRRAMISCKSGKVPVQNHFREVTKMVALGSRARRELRDYKLTRYACYLIAQNGDPRKEEIALAQAYFAVQTRSQEIVEQRMREIQRPQGREALADSEKQLAAIAFERGVGSKGFARIKSQGDSALFGGYDTKGLPRPQCCQENSPARALAEGRPARDRGRRDSKGGQGRLGVTRFQGGRI